jgi:hypothetical protein
VVAQGQAPATGRLGLLQAMVDRGEADSITEADQIDQQNKLLGKYAPDPIARANRDDALIQKGVDAAVKKAKSQYAQDHGYYLDSQGQARYGADNKKAKVKRGDVVNDPDFEEDMGKLQQAADDAASARKVPTASDLYKGAKAGRQTARDTPTAMPKTAKDAVKGQVYNTARGPARWDGNHFIPVK